MNANVNEVQFKVDTTSLELGDETSRAADPAHEESADSTANTQEDTENTQQVVQPDDEIKKLNNQKREAISKLSQTLDILLDSEDKEAVLETLKANPALFTEAKRRFPKKLQAIEEGITAGEDTDGSKKAFQKVASIAEQELLVERVLEDRTFKTESKLTDDEFEEVKDTADAIMKVNPSMTRSRALRTALSTIVPEKSAPSVRKSPETPRGEGASGINDSLAKYRGIGLTGEDAALAAELEQKGAKVSYDFGQFSVSLK